MSWVSMAVLSAFLHMQEYAFRLVKSNVTPDVNA